MKTELDLERCIMRTICPHIFDWELSTMPRGQRPILTAQTAAGRLIIRGPAVQRTPAVDKAWARRLMDQLLRLVDGAQNDLIAIGPGEYACPGGM